MLLSDIEITLQIYEMGDSEISKQLATLIKSVQDLTTDVASLKTSIESIQNSSKMNSDTTQLVMRTVQCLEKKIVNSEADINEFRFKIKSIQDRLIYMESQSRRENLLIDGIPEVAGQENCLKTVYEIFEKSLKIDNAKDIKIVRCHRMGPPRQQRGANTRPRPIIVKFHWFGDREKVWNSRKNLKDTDIFLNEDFPREIVERRKTLWPVMKAARERDHESFIVVDKLHIKYKNGAHATYTVDNLCSLPEGLHPYDLSTKKTDQCLAFFSQLCPLSNFYKCSIKIDGQNFHSSEQFYQYSKAQFANDDVTAQKIMQSDSPALCKSLGENLKVNAANWQRKSEEIMAKALHHKMSQNEIPRKFLIQSGNRVLAESSPNDKYWGTGKALKSADATSMNWPGQNLLGKLLMSIRDKYQSPPASEQLSEC